MTNYPPSHDPQPYPPYAPAPFYPPPPYGVRQVPRPPLTAEQKKTAQSAGGLCFTLFAIGSTVAFTAFVIAILIAIFGAIEAMGNTFSFTEVLAEIGLSGLSLTIITLAVLVVGVIMSVVAVSVSGRWLTSRQVYRPWKTTWAALGIAIVGWYMSYSILSFIVTAAFFFAPAFGLVNVVIDIVLALVLAVVSGVFAWWWMAHALRAPHNPHAT